VAELTAAQAETFERCMAVGGMAVFPADTVYGVACDPDAKEAVQRICLLKRRPISKPSAVMFFQPSLALAALPELGPRTRDALLALLPGAVTLILPNPAGRFPLAAGEDRSTIGLRVPALPPALAALERVTWPVWQSSANLAGGRPARRLEEVPRELRLAADMVLDGGELPGTASTVVDLRAYEDGGTWTVQRAGAMSEADLAARLA
jgi:L-threonylcarbamoyladenylate synthase